MSDLVKYLNSGSEPIMIQLDRILILCQPDANSLVKSPYPLKYVIFLTFHKIQGRCYIGEVLISFSWKILNTYLCISNVHIVICYSVLLYVCGFFAQTILVV